MQARQTMLIVGIAAMLGGCTGTPQSQSSDSAMPVFAPARVHDAIREAGMDRLVVLDFTATWCGPCKLMERTVWNDPRVEEWIKDHRAILLRSDADANTDERDAYGVSAWPTVLVLRRGEVVERRLGFQSAEQLLGLLHRAATGGTGPNSTEIRVLPAVDSEKK